MRTFVRALAFIAVIGIGLLLLFGGVVLILALPILLPQFPQEDGATASAPVEDAAPAAPATSRDTAAGPAAPARNPVVEEIDRLLALGEPPPPPAPPVDSGKIVAQSDREEAMQQKNLGALFSGALFPMVAGLVLTFSGIILAAVRPRQRQVVARPVLGNAAVLASMAQARPAVAPAPDPMPEPQAPPARPAAPTFERAMPVSKGRAMKNALLIVGIALIGIGLLVSLVGTCHHNPHSSSSPAFGGRGFYSSSGGDATAIIAGGALILVTGAGLVVVGQFLSRGGRPKR